MIKTKDYIGMKEGFIHEIPGIVSGAIVKKFTDTVTALTQGKKFPEEIKIEYDETMFEKDTLESMRTLKDDESLKTAFIKGFTDSIEIIKKDGWILTPFDEQEFHLVAQAAFNIVMKGKSESKRGLVTFKAQ